MYLCTCIRPLSGITYPMLAFSYDEVLIPYFNFSDQRLCCSLETNINFINRYIMQHKNSFFKLYVQDYTRCVWEVAKLCVCSHFRCLMRHRSPLRFGLRRVTCAGCVFCFLKNKSFSNNKQLLLYSFAVWTHLY